MIAAAARRRFIGSRPSPPPPVWFWGKRRFPTNPTKPAPFRCFLQRLAADGGLKGATVSIDAIACNATIATAIKEAGADYLLAVKANRPTLRAEIEAYFTAAPAGIVDTVTEWDKGRGRIEERAVTVSHEADWLDGDRRFPGELRLPGVATIIEARSKTELKDRCRADARYCISSANLTAEAAATAVRGHWGIENSLHWVLDVVFSEDQARLRTGHGAKNMAVVRRFAINLVRAVTDKKSLKLRRKAAGWDTRYMKAILGLPPPVNLDSLPCAQSQCKGHHPLRIGRPKVRNRLTARGAEGLSEKSGRLGARVMVLRIITAVASRSSRTSGDTRPS
jgi:predicted transposase YbfD/YdcC